MPDSKDSKKMTLLASARAVEAFAPIAEQVRDDQVLASAGRRDGARITRGNVEIIFSPDLLFLQRGSEEVVGALKLHASQEYRLEREALLNATAILDTYLEESRDNPDKSHCVVVDVFTPAFETAPVRLRRRMQAVDAASEEIEGWRTAMYERVRDELEARGNRRL